MLKEELNVIKQAILNELEGYEFYKMAAKQTGTAGSAEAFLELASEEKKHIDYLEAYLLSLRMELRMKRRWLFQKCHLLLIYINGIS